jgi:hypothetical protein
MQHDKKGKKSHHFLATLQNFPKQLWDFMEILRLCVLRLCDDYGKQAKKQGDPRRSPIFMGIFGQKPVDLVDNRQIWDLLEENRVFSTVPLTK